MARTEPHRKAAYRRGIASEYAAALLLVAKGYRILAMRYRSPAGEIDIVARRGRHFAFVEVKARHDVESGLAAISPQAQGRSRRAAEAWLAQSELRGKLPEDFTATLDLIVMRPWRLPRHFPGAFGHELC